jgi:hypothetical protein
LAGDLDANDPNRTKLILQAHDLRGDLVTLVSMQLAQSMSGYDDLLAKLGQVTDSINAGAAQADKIVAVVSGAAALAASIDNLLQQAVQLGKTAAQF